MAHIYKDEFIFSTQGLIKRFDCFWMANIYLMRRVRGRDRGRKDKENTHG